MNPIATTFVILLIFVVSFLAFERPNLEARWVFRPEDVLARKEYYRLITSGFLHGGWAHLLVNVYTLYAFGGPVELIYGPGGFLLIYFGSIVGGNLLSAYVHRHHEYAAYGASGGVCGVIFASILHHPRSHMLIFPFPYALPGWLFAIAFLGASFYALKNVKDNIGHDAHMGGAILGLIIAALLRPHAAASNWLPLTAMLLAASLIFAYLLINPLFLPLSSIVELRRPKRTQRQSHGSKRSSVRRAQSIMANLAPAKDWLIEEIELHVGSLHKDPTGTHHWIDKFERTYDVLSAPRASFDAQAFQRSVLERLNQPGVDFVVVDTRALPDPDVARLRVFFANLPDAQFNRVIRSFAFKQRS